MKATIKTMAVNPKKSLDSATKRQLNNMISHEFARKSTQFNASKAEEERKIMDKYLKSVGFSKLKANLIKAQSVLQDAEKALSKVGLDETGKLRYLNREFSEKYPEDAKKIEQIKKAIDELFSKDLHSLEQKIIARLWCSSTIGEAIVIVNEVMGNDIIPTLQQSDIQAITMQ